MTDEEVVATPRPRRRLGLGLRKGARTTPGLRQQLYKADTPLTAHNKSVGETDAVETPRTYPLKIKSSSTICRRLGLSRHRKDLSKKKLEFVNASDNIANVSAQIVAEEQVKAPLDTDWRQRQIVELKADIATWTNGFVAALDDLQALMEPRVSKELLLTQLGIPLEMLRYLDEED